MDDYIKKIERDNQQLEQEVVETRAINNRIKQFLYNAINDLDQYFKNTQIKAWNADSYENFHAYMKDSVFKESRVNLQSSRLNPEFVYVLKELEKQALDEFRKPDRISPIEQALFSKNWKL